MMKYINNFFSYKIIYFFIFIFLLLFLSYLNFSLNKQIYYKHNTSFTIAEGQTVSQSIQLLKSKKIISSVYRIKILAYIYSINPRFIMGKYEITKNDTEYSLLIKFIKGKVRQETITIIEGSTYANIINALSNNKFINFNDNDHTYYNKDFHKLNIKNYEGLCFPDTYKYSPGITSQEFLSNCYEKMQYILLKYWRDRDYSLPYKTPYEMLIMASIIEKESYIVSEKPIIASVFINRLNTKMRLQADPTVIYGMKNFTGNISKKDLRTKNEYNTYRIHGLPKTPICLPGEESIKAASRPSKTNYIYFVADKKGRHVFSENYKDHVNAVNKYQKK